LTNPLIDLKALFAAGFTEASSKILRTEYLLKSLFNQELEGCKIRSHVKWLEEGEVPSRYFFGLANQRHAKSLISCVLAANGTEVFSLPEIIAAHEFFYTKLFAKDEINSEVQADLLSCVTRRLSEEEQESCEGPVCLEEVSAALGLSNHNKTPGPDGLPVEFYLTFWSNLGPLFIEVFNESLSDGELCNSMKTSITRLVFKKGDRKSLKNWRSISKC